MCDIKHVSYIKTILKNEKTKKKHYFSQNSIESYFSLISHFSHISNFSQISDFFRENSTQFIEPNIILKAR